MSSSPTLPLYSSRYPTPNGYPQINGEVDAPLDFRKVESLRSAALSIVSGQRGTVFIHLSLSILKSVESRMASLSGEGNEDFGTGKCELPPASQPKSQRTRVKPHDAPSWGEGALVVSFDVWVREFDSCAAAFVRNSRPAHSTAHSPYHLQLIGSIDAADGVRCGGQTPQGWEVLLRVDGGAGKNVEEG
uniref:Uncharacterized protein n=1 Tax=Anopheles atroparvus TaxID=41427 RepID=A0A182IVB4_ANOAO